METRESARSGLRIPTPLAVVLIGGWLLLAAGAAGTLLITGGLSVAFFYGESPMTEAWIEGIGFSVTGVVAAAAGPLGVWLFHRRRGWLIGAAAVVAITVLGALYILLTFGSA